MTTRRRTATTPHVTRASSRLAVQQHRRLARWLQLAIVAWLTLVLTGRDHALQAIGVHLACVHPGAPASTHGAEDDDEHHAAEAPAADDDDRAGDDGASDDAPDARRADLDPGDECPADCTDCACGAAPFATTVALTFATRRYRDQVAPAPNRSRAGPTRPTTSLERPPRHA